MKKKILYKNFVIIYDYESSVIAKIINTNESLVVYQRQRKKKLNGLGFI